MGGIKMLTERLASALLLLSPSHFLPAIPYDIDLNLLDTFELPAADVNSLIREVRPFHPSNLPLLHTPPSSHIHTPQISCDSTRTERQFLCGLETYSW